MQTSRKTNTLGVIRENTALNLLQVWRVEAQVGGWVDEKIFIKDSGDEYGSIATEVFPKKDKKPL